MDKSVSIDAMIAQMMEAALQLEYSPTSIWGNMVPRWKSFSNYYRLKGLTLYDPAVTNEFVELQRARMVREEISYSHFRAISAAANRLNQYYLSGNFAIKMPKVGSPFRVSPQNEQLISDFIQARDYGPNTREDVSWVLRRYLGHFEHMGYSSLAEVTVDQVREFILKTAEDVKLSTLHDIMLYLKYFHYYLVEASIPAPNCGELFSYKICREMPIQGYVTDEELRKILGVINRNTDAGKRDLAIILVAATTGLRACDIIRLKLTDIDWQKAEIIIVQKKTGQVVYCPLLKEVGEALQDYILNGRPNTGCEEIFLRTIPPKTTIETAAAVGNMFKSYQEKAGIARYPFDGKGFHGLRRRLARNLLVTGTPVTTIVQILGHDDPQASRQYLALDSSNLSECALGFQGICVERRELL